MTSAVAFEGVWAGRRASLRLNSGESLERRFLGVRLAGCGLLELL